MVSGNAIKTVRSLVRDIDFVGKSLLSINDLSNDQLYGLFELARALEPWNRSAIPYANRQRDGRAIFPAQHPNAHEF